MSSNDEPSAGDDEYDEKRELRQRPRKRRKRNDGRVKKKVGIAKGISLVPLLELVETEGEGGAAFNEVIEQLLPEYLHTRATFQEKEIETDQLGNVLRPLTRSEISSVVDRSPLGGPSSLLDTIALRKLKLDRQRRRIKFNPQRINALEAPLTPLNPARPPIPANPQVLDALYSIHTTPFENSFISRLQGTRAGEPPGVIAIDWETVTPWMSLMTDIRAHYSLAHADREQPIETVAPIIYTSLQASQLSQIHDLLERVFWTGIDVTDSLDYWPERSTVIATYKKLVVGVAILSSPRETYITYLAVRAGWDKAQIARTVLYHLISLNPGKDITLHVSVNSSAMLLYNQFGFKAEGFVAGFYEDYLDPASRASKNAFRLRLRQQ